MIHCGSADVEARTGVSTREMAERSEARRRGIFLQQRKTALNGMICRLGWGAEDDAALPQIVEQSRAGRDHARRFGM